MALVGKTNEEKIYNYLKSKGFNDYAVSGIMGNLCAESGLKSNNLQDTGNRKLGMTDDEYIKAVDNGTYTKEQFVYDSQGFGICQWTWWKRKENLYEYAKSQNKSIGDLEMQLNFLMKELNEDYKSVLKVLKRAKSVLEASNVILLKFECPADQSVSAQNKRASYGQVYYDKYAAPVTQDDVNTGGIKMNENELRKKVVSTAISYLGCKESDGTHKKIIDIYNNCAPLPSAYKVTYTDAWCATYVSAIGIASGLKDVILRECSCNRMIELYKKAGRWIENDAYTPQIADIIFYDWQDNGVGNNVGGSDHVGIVVSVSGTTIKVIEGNMNNSVGYRTMKVNGKYIRGYGVPNYAGKTNLISPEVNDNYNDTSIPDVKNTNTFKYNVGDIVKFTGNTHYVAPSSTSPKTCKAGTAKVTARSKGAKHPYHLIAEKGKGSNVYGWVDESDIAGKISAVSGNGTGINTTVNSDAKVKGAQSFSESIAGTYKVLTGLNMRSGAGTSNAILTVIPRGEEVNCYGYYTNVSGTKWYYITYQNSKGIRFTGFVSSKHLKRIR